MTSLLTRSRLLAAVVFVISVALCAAAVKASDAGHDFDQVAGVTGVQVDLEGGWIRVEEVRVGQTLVRDLVSGDSETIGTTPGLFVVATVTVAATGPENVAFSRANLVTRDRTYGGWDDTFAVAESGFRTTRQSIWEVDPADIDDLTLQFEPGSLVAQYEQRPAVHLGITADNAQQWRDTGRGATLTVRTDTVTEGLR